MKGNVKLKVISGLTVVMILSILVASSMLTKTFAATSLNIPDDNIVFAGNDNKVELDLSGNGQGNNICAFTKDDSGNFTKFAFNRIDNTDIASFSITEWNHGAQKEYYVAVTDRNEAYINDFNGKTGTVNGDTVTLTDNDSAEFLLHKIIVICDNAPVIDSINISNTNWTKDDVTLTVNAHDSDNGDSIKYSFDNGENWQAGNSKTFSTNQEVKILVKDGCEQVCKEAKTINIDKIDKTAPTIIFPQDLNNDNYTYFGMAELYIRLSDSLSGINESTLNVQAPGVDVYKDRQANGDYKIWFFYGGDSYKNDVNISVSDNAGNTTTKTIVNLTIDNKKPTANIINNTVDDTWMRGSNSFDFYAEDFETSIDLSQCYSNIPDAKGTVSFELKDATTNTYTATITANPGQKINQQVTLTIKDEARNDVNITTEKNIRIDNEKPGVNNLSVENKTAVKNGDTATVSFNLDDYNGVGCDDTQTVQFAINGSELKTATFDNGKFTADFIIGTDVILEDNDKITVTNLVCEDKLDNKVTAEESVWFETDCNFLGDIEISSVKFTSNNTNNHLAKNDDKVCVEFLSNHPVNILGSMSQGTNVISDFSSLIPEKDRETHLYIYKAYLVVDNIPSYDNNAFKFDLSITDAAGNAPVRITDEDADLALEPIIYYAPIDSTINSISLTSDGANAGFVKKNDNVSLNINTKHPVTISDTRIAGSDVPITPSEDNLTWTGTKEIDGNGLTDNSDIQFSFKITDAAGNVGQDNQIITKTQDVAAKVKFYDNISILDINMSSDNNTSHIAKNGDKIHTSFKTSHPVVLTSSKIAGKDITFISDDGMNWSADYTVAQGDTEDNAFVSLNLVLDDVAGNESISADQNSNGIEKITYYAPIKIYDVVVTTNNFKNGTKYAKNGDEVKVTFKSNHDVSISDADIVGKNAVLSKNNLSGSAKQFALTYSIKNGDIADLAIVKFAFKANDIAGNPQVVKNSTDSDIINSIQYFSPITAQTSIASNYRKTNFAKNGDTITVSSRANHEVSIVDAKIFNRDTVNSIENGKSLNMSYRIPQNENALAQGNVTFTYTITDLAGNVLSENHPSVATNNVTYDRTLPTIAMTPQFNGFTNKDMNYIFTFADENLSSNDISIRVNGVEQLTQSDKATNGKTFNKTITLSAEKEYEVIATLLDSAGNKCQQDKIVKITIDKTSPKITSSKVDLTKSTSFKSGIKLSEILDIDEKYINEVICNITDSNGTHDIGIDDPITGDGKKTVNIIVKDMAGNISQTMTYDFYIDGTPPKLEIRNTDKKSLSPEKTVTFKDKLKLKIGLDSFSSDKTKLEKFTTLKLLNSKGETVVDLLEEETPLSNGGYEIKVDKFGKYTLEVQAVDSAGNDTGLLKYNFIVKDKTITEKFVSNKPLMIGSIAGIIVIIGAVILFVIKRKNRYYL